MESLEERFWSKVDIPLDDDGKPDKEECWLWKASVNSDGYGHLGISGKTVKAHRVAFCLENGDFDGTKCVLHRCDTPRCCNPEHLWLGTIKDNNQDCIKKGRDNKACGDKNGARVHPERMPRGDKNGSRTHPEGLARGDRHYYKTNPEKILRGENHGSAKLTWKKVREIRNSPELQRELAIKYGVCQTTISRIKINKIWKEQEFVENE